MKKVVVFIIFLFVGFTSISAQNKNAKATIEVDGVCMMCKDRIEKACFKTKGVKSAAWNVETKELKLIYNDTKTNLQTIKSNIANVGHDTDDIKAPLEIYNELHHCCKYREEEVIEDHN